MGDGPDEGDEEPDMVKVGQLVGRPDYGVAFCVSPWPDGGWLAGVALIDRDWVEEQVGWGVMLPGLLTMIEQANWPRWSVFDGFPAGISAHGLSMAEAIDLLFNAVIAAR